MNARIPTHLEVSGMIRAVQSAGGFATVLQKGERDAGTLAIATFDRNKTVILYERMPQLDGSRNLVSTKIQDTENKQDFLDYLQRRCAQDRDLWLIEVEIADAERFVATLAD